MTSFTYDPGVKLAAGTSNARIAPLSPTSRTTIIYDTLASVPVVVCHPASRVTMVFDRSTSLAEPVGSRTVTVFDGDSRSLRRLFDDLSRQAPGDISHELIEAILDHNELKRDLTRACRDLPQDEDVRQQSLLRLWTILLKRKATLEDVGEPQFHAWIWQVVKRTVSKAARDCAQTPAPILAADMSRFADSAAESEIAEYLDDMRAAIPKIPNVDVRRVIEDMRLGLTVAKSAELRGLSRSHVWDLRQHGIEWLRGYLFGD